MGLFRGYRFLDGLKPKKNDPPSSFSRVPLSGWLKKNKTTRQHPEAVERLDSLLLVQMHRAEAREVHDRRATPTAPARQDVHAPRFGPTPGPWFLGQTDPPPQAQKVERENRNTLKAEYIFWKNTTRALLQVTRVKRPNK